jgi:hypothetical protein
MNRRTPLAATAAGLGAEIEKRGRMVRMNNVFADG